MPKLSFGLDTPCSKIVSALKFLNLMTDPVIFYINALKRLWPTTTDLFLRPSIKFSFDLSRK